MQKQGRAANNSVYLAKAGEVVNQRSMLLRNFVLNGKKRPSSPLLRVPEKYYD
ncbi:hypothetical protein [Peijinzhouia sedimentorum]